MSIVHEFDVRSRGVAQLVEAWKSPQATVRCVWKIDDLIGASIDAVRVAKEIHGGIGGSSADNGSRSTSEVPTYFVELLRSLNDAIATIEDVAASLEAQDNLIERMAELHDASKLLQRILAETEASVEAAEWEKLDREALSTQELLEIREYLRQSGQASA